ncbi:hypothetical protein HPB47_016555, partial [Ixodes persulcatus]
DRRPGRWTNHHKTKPPKERNLDHHTASLHPHQCTAAPPSSLITADLKGIPVFFKPNSSKACLWRVNPNEVAKEIIDVTQKKLLSHRMNKESSLSWRQVYPTPTHGIRKISKEYRSSIPAEIY